LNKINIAIDGHSSCGKSTLARDLARALDYIYIDSGAMYRAVALYMLEHDVDISNSESVIAKLDDIRIGIKYPEGQFLIELNGKNITDRIKAMDVSAIVSEVAAISEVRSKLVELQQKLGADKCVVMDGRDIGTVVFPDAELKLFVTASLDVRAQRRYDELKAKGIEVDLDEVSRNLQHRDHIDSTREDSPLVQAEDALLLDNSHWTREQQLEEALTLAQSKIEKPLT